MLHYVLEIIIFQLGFLLMYELLLKKETFFSYNRWYLLLTPVLAMLLPLLKLEFLTEAVPADRIMLPGVILGNDGVTAGNSPVATNEHHIFQVNWWLAIYAGGALVSTYLFLKKFSDLNRLFRFRKISEEKDFKIIEIPNSRLACTFFHTIFLGDQLSEEEKQQILPHELAHVKQNHSADLLYFEIMKILFWFNPLIYIYQTRIAGLHEFLADEEVIKTTEKKTYYQQLLNSAFSTRNIPFINQFFSHSLLKKRIIMLKRSKSKAIAKARYSILIPLMLLMLTYVAYAEKGIMHSQDTTEIKQAKASHPKPQLSPIPFAVVDEVPVFTGCEELTSNDERKKCTTEKITAFVADNFNKEALREYSSLNDNRIVVQFKIDKTGKVTDVRSRAVTPGLEPEARKMQQQEAERVILAIPKMKPGKQKGETVGVMYSLPIVFKI
ncbi:M56 family metallopeptidase [Zunongwangia sp. F363]|uniref:M56 family metallopeptidase n=1 Tax=Autumnicola tepida TaxID=3075595 RepID=A0ABU3CCB4_9FLAO|nr:M56 family metallopeptidase [Zunongwangia sp. F363]MDT0643857.1 M56 family metallopeptidase [Zunongwangia sp. F363]